MCCEAAMASTVVQQLTLRSKLRFRVIAPGLLNEIEDAKLGRLHLEAQHPMAASLALLLVGKLLVWHKHVTVALLTSCSSFAPQS
jgi:hypothetical protein